VTLEFLRDTALEPFQHGFFTRKGGKSTGVFAGLNCGLSSGDLGEDVRENRVRVTRAIGREPETLCTVRQVHGTEVARITSAEDHDRSIEADAMVTSTPGVVLGILTADCQPVLFADRKAGVIGAAHAGWRGALDGVLERTIDAMVALGAERNNLAAVIGPTISQRAYEVGPEFIEPFLDDDPDNHRFFVNGSGDKYHFDLPSYGVQRLCDAGVCSAHWTRHCTYSDKERFYSYRRTVHHQEPDYGRLISVIATDSEPM
jgi:YfiH family protein